MNFGAGATIAAASAFSAVGCRGPEDAGRAAESTAQHALQTEVAVSRVVPQASGDAGESPEAQRLEVREPTTVQAVRPEIAVPHAERETDFLALAKAQVDRGEAAQAFDSLRKHLYTSPPTSEVLLNLGRLGRQIGQNAIAEQALLDAVALDPRNAEVELELARVLLDVGELEAARTHARQAIRLDGENAAAWNVAGRVALQQGELARSELAFRRSVALDPMNAMAYNNLGLLYIHMHRATDAVDALEASVELFGEEVPRFVYNNLGLAHEMAEHYDDAREAFEAALVRDPEYVRAAVNLKRVMGTIASLDSAASYDTARGVEVDDATPPLF